MKKLRFGINRKFLIISVVVMGLAALFVVLIFFRLYDTSRQNIINSWKNNTVQASSDVGYFLSIPESAVSFSAINLNEMIDHGASPQEVAEYLISESEVYSTIIEGNYTGIHAYYKGEYLDGSGWEPDEDYDPTSRPWYQDALKGRGRTMFVLPYLNIQNHTMMMSVSRLLSDQESVVSMDIFLVELQDMMKSMVVENDADSAMIIDRSGCIVAHSDRSEVGKIYGIDGGEFEKSIIESITISHESSIELERDGEQYIAFSNKCSNDWYVVLLLNEENVFHSLRFIFASAASALIIVLVVVFAVFAFMGRKQSEVEHLGKEIEASANIYVAMSLVDLTNDTITCLRGSERLDALLGGDFANYSNRTKLFAEKMSSEQYCEATASFLDISTIEERLANVKAIAYEFLDITNRWVRARYIVVDRDKNNKLLQILWTLESIDEDRKMQEKFRVLSETDRMTGILNRGSGEQKIREKMQEGLGGMFWLMDADKFKSINDNFGHSVGDKVIIAIASCLKKSFRDTDIVFRLGGDEFAAYAVDAKGEEIGRMIAMRFFGAIDRIEIPELGDHKIHISIGAAFCDPNTGESFEELYQRADKGTYLSKKEEGNFITFQ